MTDLSAPRCDAGVSLPAADAREAFAKRLVLRLLQPLRRGTLILHDGAHKSVFGADEGEGPTARIDVHDEAMYREVLLRGSIGAGESYMAGHWSSPDLTAVVRVMALNAHLLDDLDGRAFSVRKLLTAGVRFSLRAYHAVRANSRRGSQRNIAAHYDLGNDFYALFLDASMMYSAAIFPRADSTLEQASLHKIDRICKRLQLTPRDHLVEIGTGWGGLALHAAQNYGCRVTTTTISREQFTYAQARIAEAGLSDRVTVLLQDYRDLRGQYDKLVSIEMIEAVGHRFYPEYFSQCAALLKADGLMLIQAITIPDQRFAAAARSVDFIQRHIFPGGALPSLGVIAQTVTCHTDLIVSGIDDITPHYARTLRAWRERFTARLEWVRALGYDERFIRMWQFYLCYCEGGFMERSIGTHQILFAKPDCRLEPLLGSFDDDFAHTTSIVSAAERVAGRA